MSILLPRPLPENERKAIYDYKISGDTVKIVWYNGNGVEVVWDSGDAGDFVTTGSVESDSRQYEWHVGICCAPFAITRLVPIPSARTKLSHWGVYFLRADHDSKEGPGNFVLGINFNNGRKGLMLETVWHTENGRKVYDHNVCASDITKVDDPRFPELKMVYSYREIILHAQLLSRQFVDSILLQVPASAIDNHTGYQLLTNNCKKYSKALYMHLDFYRYRNQPKDWLLPRLSDRKGIEVFCSDLLLLNRNFGQDQTFPAKQPSTLRSLFSHSSKRIRLMLGMVRPFTFRCFCQHVQLPIETLVMHFFLVEKMHLAKVGSILRDRFKVLITFNELLSLTERLIGSKGKHNSIMCRRCHKEFAGGYRGLGFWRHLTDEHGPVTDANPVKRWWKGFTRQETRLKHFWRTTS